MPRQQGWQEKSLNPSINSSRPFNYEIMEKSKLQENTNKLFNAKLKVINVGLSHFAETIRIQGIEVVQVNWKPVAGGDKKLGSILDSIGFDD